MKKKIDAQNKKKDYIKPSLSKQSAFNTPLGAVSLWLGFKICGHDRLMPFFKTIQCLKGYTFLY